MTENTATIIAVLFVEDIFTSQGKYMNCSTYIYLMIIKFGKGQSLNYLSKECGVSTQELVEYNGFEPQEGDWFVLPEISALYVVQNSDSPLAVSRKTGLSVEDVVKRCGGNFMAGKKIYY